MNMDKYIDALAGASCLETLSFVTTAGRPSETKGNKIFKQMMTAHGSALKVLKLPNFHLPMELVSTFFAKCRNIEELWCGVSYNVMVGLTFIVPCLHSLTHFLL
jgi:hypothetical protein